MNHNSTYQFMDNNQSWTKVTLPLKDGLITSNADIDDIRKWCNDLESDSEYTYLYNYTFINFWFSDKNIALLFRLRWLNEISSR